MTFACTPGTSPWGALDSISVLKRQWCHSEGSEESQALSLTSTTQRINSRATTQQSPPTRTGIAVYQPSPRRRTLLPYSSRIYSLVGDRKVFRVFLRFFATLRMTWESRSANLMLPTRSTSPKILTHYVLRITHYPRSSHEG